MTIISSGGFLPINNLSTILNTNIKEIIFSLMMLISFFSIFLTYNLIFLKNKNINFFQEDILLFFYFLFLIFIFFLFFNFDYNFSIVFLSLASSVSNIGISLDESPKNLSFVFLILVIIGGSFFSTSSGIRFLKFYILFKFAINDLSFHVRPKNISPYKHFLLDIAFEKSEVYKYFLSLLIFIISFFVLTSLLSISEISFENSFKLSILTIMNTVNSPMYGLDGFNFLDLQFYTKYFLIIFMIIGRVELLTLLIFFKKFLFKN